MSDRIIEYEDDEDNYFEIEVEIDVEECPSGPYHYGGGSYWFGTIVGMKKYVEGPEVPGLPLNSSMEEVDLEGEWFKEHEEEIQAHVDRIIDEPEDPPGDY